jgi:hypothetical protein
MGTFRGTHGTSQYRAQEILRVGFKASVVGRAGTGVYLWAYEGDATIARELAEGWFAAQARRNVFDGERDPEARVLYAEVEADEAACINCDTLVFEETLTAYLRKLCGGNDAGYSTEDISIAYNAVISSVERKRQVEFCVVHARVVPPDRMKFKEKVVIGNPLVHIVRKALERIQIKLGDDTGRFGEDWAVAV